MKSFDMNYMFFGSNDLTKYYKRKYIYKYFNTIKRNPIFDSISGFLDEDTLLELKFTCKKFKNKIEENKDLINRANKAELKKVREKLVKILI